MALAYFGSFGSLGFGSLGAGSFGLGFSCWDDWKLSEGGFTSGWTALAIAFLAPSGTVGGESPLRSQAAARAMRKGSAGAKRAMVDIEVRVIGGLSGAFAIGEDFLRGRSNAGGGSNSDNPWERDGASYVHASVWQKGTHFADERGAEERRIYDFTRTV